MSCVGRASAVFLVFAFFSVLTLGCSTLSGEQGGEGLDSVKAVGFGDVSLHLGMTPGEAATALEKGGFEAGGWESDPARPELSFFMIRVKGSSGPQVGSFTVRSGRIVEVWKSVKRYAEDVPAGTVLVDVAEELKKLSNKEGGVTRCTWRCGGIQRDGSSDNTSFEWDVADGRLCLGYANSKGGSRTADLAYVVGSSEPE